MIKYIIALFVVLLLGCTTNYKTPVKVSIESLNNSNGILIGSFSRDPEGPVYASQTFYFKNSTTGILHQIKSQLKPNIISSETPDDFKTSESHGGVFIFSLPAGKYSFYDFRLHQSNGPTSKTWTSKPYSIPFEVKPNKVNYVGEIKLSPAAENNIFGMEVLAESTWVFSEQLARDLVYLTQKHPDIPYDNIVNVIPVHKDIFTPLVILPSEKLNLKNNH